MLETTEPLSSDQIEKENNLSFFNPKSLVLGLPDSRWIFLPLGSFCCLKAEILLCSESPPLQLLCHH